MYLVLGRVSKEIAPHSYVCAALDITEGYSRGMLLPSTYAAVLGFTVQSVPQERIVRTQAAFLDLLGTSAIVGPPQNITDRFSIRVI